MLARVAVPPLLEHRLILRGRLQEPSQRVGFGDEGYYRCRLLGQRRPALLYELVHLSPHLDRHAATGDEQPLEALIVKERVLHDA
eukprot:2550819-Prymnesium_polylepis.2